MSELAFNLNGEPLEFPPNAVGLRVRRLEKGAPKTVYSKEGTPLTLPLDADMADLRREVRGAEGRYRLDPVDEDNRSIANAPAAYVYVHPPEPIEAPVHQAPHGPSDPVVEAMRMNTELARTIVDKLPLMMESAAGLLRAAGDAGLPTRVPRLIFESAEDEVSGDDDTESAAPKDGWVALVETILPYLAPALGALATSGKLNIPGGIGALLDCRRASSAGARAPRAPEGGPAPGHDDPAPAARAPSGAHARRMAAAPAAAKSTANATPGTRVSEPAAPARVAPAADTPKEGTAGAVPSGLPTLDATAMSRLAAIQAGLTLQEQMLAQALIAELTPDQLRALVAELMPLSIAEAIAEIRAILGPDVEGIPDPDAVLPGLPGLPGGGS